MLAWLHQQCRSRTLPSPHVLISDRATSAYALEKYPDHSTAVAAILNAWRVGGGFSVAYFQPGWLANNGAAAVFSTQAGIVAISSLLFILPVILMGRRTSVEERG